MTLKARVRRLAVRGSRAWYRFRGPRPPGPPEPPKVPEGWRVGPPHYVGVGAQKAGTSWWNRLIEAHPDVVDAGGRPKELHFFDRSWETPFGEAEVRRYHRYFPVPEGRVAGEWTPGYLIDFWTPELIARAAPHARVLLLLRDPVDRFRSGLTHQLATSREPLKHRDIQGAFQRGLYAPQVRRVLAAFPREQVWVGQYERCRAHPAAELARTYDFLGLAPHALDAEAFRSEVNPTTREKFEPSTGLRSSLLEGYAADMAQLAELLPELDLSSWPSARAVGLA
ncbi:MAG: sulfotransferase domain-containing protein [Candidatus Limnocylindrales bacterium]